MNCKNCKRQGCSFAGKSHEMSFECRLYVGKTNADRIRSMTDEELADFCFRITDDVASYYGGDGYEPKYPVASKGWLGWLRQEANDVGQ